MQDLESKERRADMAEPVPKGGHRNSARRSYRRQIRASVRQQISNSRRRRHELSQVLGVMRQDLFEFRTWLRTRLRVSSSEASWRDASWRKAGSPPAAPPKQLSAAAAPPKQLPAAAAPARQQDAVAPSTGTGHVPTA